LVTDFGKGFVSVALWLLRIVASMYKPFSVNALGGLFFPPQLEVKIFDSLTSFVAKP